MKKTLICALLLVILFTNISSMEESFSKERKIDETENIGDIQEHSDLYKVRLHIFELLIKDLIENNSVFEPSKGVKKVIANIILVNKEFNHFRPDLIKFAKEYVKNYFFANAN